MIKQKKVKGQKDKFEEQNKWECSQIKWTKSKIQAEKGKVGKAEKLFKQENAQSKTKPSK